MNLTLAVDEATVERAREVAGKHGTSLEAMIREYLERLAGQVSGDQLVGEFEQMCAEPGDSGGNYTFDREAIYAERSARYKPR